MGEVLRVGLVQMHCGEDPEDNLGRALDGLAAAAARGAQLVGLPELFRTAYFCQTQDPRHFAHAESVPGPTSEAIGARAAELGVIAVAPLFERRAPGIYHNSAVVLGRDGAIAGLYRKMHIPDEPRYCEKYYFTPGDLGFPALDCGPARVGCLICWDQWFPEAARAAALAGVQILFCPTSIGWERREGGAPGAAVAREIEAWEVAQRAHAIANGIFVVAINRVGEDGDLIFWGRSFAADPFGQMLGSASQSAEEVLVVDCDLDRIREVRCSWPFLRDRRIDAYGDLQLRWRDG